MVDRRIMTKQAKDQANSNETLPNAAG